MKKIIWILCAVLVLTVFTGCSGSKETMFWDETILGDKIPALSNCEGEICYDDEDNLVVRITNTTRDVFEEYLKACKGDGYTIKQDRGRASFSAYNEEGYEITLLFYEEEARLSISLDAPMEMSENVWPDNALTKLLPTPKSTKGKLERDDYDRMVCYVGEMSEDDFAEYVAQVKAAGFVEEYSSREDRYTAKNAEGYEVEISLEGVDIVKVEIEAPEE